MNRKWYLLILVILMSMLSVPTFAQKCNRCNGYGQINKSVSVAGYGLAKKIGDCNICGHMIFSGESHNHVPCPSCGGSGKRQTSTSSSRTSSSSRKNTSSILYPSEEDEIQGILKILREGVTETRKCQTCGGTNRCPGRGRHHYGNVGMDMMNIDAAMPVYCFMCDGWGDCPNKNCMNGTEFYTRPCTESEKARLNERMNQIYQFAREREYGYSGTYNTGTSVSQSNTSHTSSTTNVSVPTTYQVTINAYNSSDEIYINGKYQTRGAYTGQFYPGNHTIECRNTGKYSTSKSINVTNAMTISMPELRKMPSLQITTGNGISIYIDGKYITTGSTTSYIDYGSHKVEFKKEKYHPVTKTININSLSGNTITVNSLEPIVGSMNITSTPAGMTVKLDGEEKGITPLIIKDVTIGNHKVELSKVHYYTETKDVEVKESEQSNVNMKMTEYARIKFTANTNDASVYVDERYIGTTPTTQDIVAGRHTIRVEGYHHRPNVRTINVSGNTGNQYFRLVRQYQRKSVFYIEPTFQCVSLNAVGGTIGFYAANVNFEGSYLYGLDKTDPVYWIAENSNEPYTPYEYTYRPSYAGGKMGYGFIIGTRVRVTPQIGAGVLMVNGSGDYGKSRGQAILGSGGLRLECALAPCLNLVAEPEYCFPLTRSDNYESIRKVESKMGKWEKGFNCRIGISLFW